MDVAMSTFEKATEGINPYPGQQPSAPAEPAPAKEAAPAPTKQDKVADGLPEEFLTGKKETVKTETTDEFEKLVNSAPNGQLRHEQFKQLQAATKAKVAALQADLAKRDEELAKLRGLEVPESAKKEHERLSKRAAELEAELERVAYERSPKFKEKFGARETAMRSQLEATAKDLGVEDHQVAQLNALSGRRRFEMIDELDIPQSAKGALSSLAMQLDGIKAEREADLGRSREELTAWQQEQEQERKQQEQALRAEEDRVFAEELGTATTTLPAFQKIEGNEAWNKEVESRIEQARQFFNGGADIKQLAQLALRGMNDLVSEKIIKAQQQRLKEYADQLSRYKSTNPGGGSAPEIKTDKSGMNPMERAMATFEEKTAGIRQY